MTSPRPVGDLTLQYLQRCGYAEGEISAWTSETRLLHDMWLCGDDILDELEVLVRDFGVDLSELKVEKYFPREFSNDAFIIAIRRLLRAIGLERVVDKILEKYSPITLGMVEAAILNKRWDDNISDGRSA